MQNMMSLPSSNTSLATSVALKTTPESTQTDTPTASVVAPMDVETRRDITMKLTLASMAAQQGREEDAQYWTDRAAKSLAEFKAFRTVA